MNKRLLATLITLFIIVIGAGIAIFLIKGYSFSSEQGRLVGTGIISATSLPTGASVYIDGHLTTATDTIISSLSPKSYSVKVTKEGFIPWEKTVEVREGLVTEVKAHLFPAIPTIYPLTYNGVVNPTLSTDGKQLAFAVPLTNEPHNRQKGGIWVWTFESGPIAFARGAQPHQIVTSTSDLDFSKAILRFSPDSSQILISLANSNYLLPVGSKTTVEDLRDVTPTIDTLLKSWEEDQKTKHLARLEIIKDQNIKNVASGSASLQWSPDETKFLVGKKVYDFGTLSESPLATPKEYDLPDALSYSWLPTSSHIILIQAENSKDKEPKKIVICEFNGLNCVVLYSGIFSEKSVFSWPDASRLMLVTSFNTPTASAPNLFGINLK
ncbi:hypothetical protein A3H85_01210 [Candidatus Daviesbacteria bacterium RIFCSPLOWO2_02_FULL_40_8]|uniref:PEGA domain-containing protein n=1 Tax=Candidatus Daviesbacteria bacterium RIFCSPLOWO2_01_FULL_40_24 TaxID=1797787 RepID=A0A1F5MKG2_9BACT|nr:MAG: hypothetical protein A2780_00560 [Candidatus Daviesbacteria bacterium RIFCSPHIGHO2_01_FULL_41_45]OGE34009.1 MAG: hypothetical protein A3C32_01075 [Candidatus Daviesbacteria bacterium RIFCSPHIGHO2_02_FULL_41_14]OGE65864.1 MAG: hypothetical protein A3B49_02835 [Candidatus Daviesbacteria bacterium RIFCSPLOWO2_01_FULL_40_24]OGE67043.1 MAG: hypothetical protein A3H85_01210 [Candidatus Daviesbacteria bacterium RIFCSPLOWO2_02_FULL_40_8]